MVASTTIPQEFVSLVFANMREHQASGCSFVRSMQDAEKSSVERFDPDDRLWVLLEIDGRIPSEKDLKKYAKEQVEREGRTLPTTLDFDELAASGSYRLVEDTDRVAIYEFTPMADPGEDEKITEALLGKLVVDKSRLEVAYFEIVNTQPFSPAIGITVSSMYQKLEYQWLEDQEVYVIGELTANVSGKAFGLKKISQTMSVRFSEFDCERP